MEVIASLFSLNYAECLVRASGVFLPGPVSWTRAVRNMDGERTFARRFYPGGQDGSLGSMPGSDPRRRWTGRVDAVVAAPRQWSDSMLPRRGGRTYASTRRSIPPVSVIAGSTGTPSISAGYALAAGTTGSTNRYTPLAKRSLEALE